MAEPSLAIIGSIFSGIASRSGSCGRIHAVDHPVLAVGPEQHVTALDALAVQDDHHLAVGPLLGFVGAVVPDRDLAGAVVAGRDLAREVDVAERMVLHVDREVVLLGIGRDAFGHGPRHENAVALEPEVPVQASSVVLLNDEPERPGSLARQPGRPVQACA